MSVNFPLGRVGFVPRPDYTPGLECFPLDAVNYKNTFWACIAQTTETPGPDSQNWVPMLSLAASLAAGGGLGLNSNNEIYVKPEAFSGALLEEMMRKMRVKIWLKQDSNWYVDGGVGSNLNDGSAPDKAFKTIQYAAHYISDNFELGSHTATISVAAGVFDEDVILPKYSASTGMMRIVGAGKNATIISGAYFGLPGASRWAISDQTIRFAGRGSPHTVNYLYDGIRMLSGSEAYLSNVLFDLGSVNGSGAVTIRSAARSVSGNIIVNTGCSFTGSGSSAFLIAQHSGNMQVNGDADFNGSVSVATLMVQSSGTFTFDTGTIGRVPVLSGTVSGPRAVCHLNGIIQTMGSGGQAAFPGTIDGGVSTGGQIV